MPETESILETMTAEERAALRKELDDFITTARSLGDHAGSCRN